MKKIKLTKDIGQAKKGEIFVQGLHEPTEHWKNQGYTRDDFYWEEGTERKEYAFLPASAFWGTDENGEEYSHAVEIDL